MNLAFQLVLRNIEYGTFRYYYALENNYLLDWSKLACTKNDLAKLKGLVNKTDLI